MNSNLVTSMPIVEGVLNQYAAAIGHDFIAYRNHVYRVVNLCLAFIPASRDRLDEVAIAAAFHDLGIWTDHTFDYIPPSTALARKYLEATRERTGFLRLRR
jgi:hypothetical protein